jgi:hypothetical protein
LSMMLAIGLLYIASIMLRYIHSIPSSIRTFIKKECCILSRAFSASIDEYVDFVLASACMLNYIY